MDMSLSKPLQPTKSPDFGAIRRYTANTLIEEDNKQNQEQAVITVVHHLDENTTESVNTGSRKMSEFLYQLSNEPSIGLYHVCDHVSRNVPKTVDTKRSLKATNKLVDDLNYDMDFTIRTVRNLHDLDTFNNIRQLISDSLTTIDMIKSKEPPKPKTLSAPDLTPPISQLPVVNDVKDTPTTKETPPASGTDDSDGPFLGDISTSPVQSRGVQILSSVGGLRAKKKPNIVKKTHGQSDFKPKAF